MAVSAFHEATLPPPSSSGLALTAPKSNSLHHSLLIPPRGLDDDEIKVIRRRHRKRKYDPWADIFQAGKFKGGAKADRRVDSEGDEYYNDDYYYYDNDDEQIYYDDYTEKTSPEVVNSVPESTTELKKYAKSPDTKRPTSSRIVTV